MRGLDGGRAQRSPPADAERLLLPRSIDPTQEHEGNAPGWAKHSYYHGGSPGHRGAGTDAGMLPHRSFVRGRSTGLLEGWSERVFRRGGHCRK